MKNDRTSKNLIKASNRLFLLLKILFHYLPFSFVFDSHNSKNVNDSTFFQTHHLNLIIQRLGRFFKEAKDHRLQAI